MSDAIHNRDAVKALDTLDCDGSEQASEQAAAILLRFLKDTGNEDVANAYHDASQRNVKREGAAT